MNRLPSVSKYQKLVSVSLEKKQHFTEPPARYTEAALIKFLEENGIGRPSTYAPIISIIIARDYVRRDGKALVGTKLGEITTEFMESHFPEIVDYEFTAAMENQLDSIEKNNNTIVGVIGDFYKRFASELESVCAAGEGATMKLSPEESEYECPKCKKKMIYKTGRYGRFLACPDYPECRSTIAVDKNGNPVKPKEPKAPELAGFKCELCGSDMVVREGKFGTFYACINYPECKFTKQKTEKIGVACPKCGADILARHAREKSVFYSCSSYPECDFSTWDRPLADKCPDCGGMLYYRKARKAVVCKARGCGYRREEAMADESR